MYIEAKVNNDDPSLHHVTLSGPIEITQIIYQGISPLCTREALLTSRKISITGYDSTFMKAAFIEEVLKYGFEHKDIWSTIKDDVIVLSRAVELQ